MAKIVTWTTTCKTIVCTDDDEEARQEVVNLFVDRTWGGTGKCGATFEDMKICGVEEQDPDTVLRVESHDVGH